MFVKSIRKLVLALLLTLILCFISPVKASAWLPVASTWSISTVDSNNHVGYNPSLALDSEGRPHISHEDITNFDLKYSVRQGNSWVTTTVDSRNYSGYQSSLALDSNGHPHISYGVRWIHGFGYEPTLKTNSPSITNIAVNGDGNEPTFLAPNTNDQQNINYNYYHAGSYDSINFDMETDYLHYAVWDGSSWKITTIESDDILSQHSSLALDSNNRPHITYKKTCLRYGVWDGNSWTTTIVDSNEAAGDGSFLVLDSNDYPHIAYYEDTNTSYYDRTNGVLKYARFTGTDWLITTVDSAGDKIMINLALDNSDQPHLTYSDPRTNDLKYAFWDGNAWNIMRIDPATLVGRYSSIALDSNDRPHITYYDVTDTTYYDYETDSIQHDYNGGVLKYARFTGTDWVIMTVDPDVRATGGMSLALDSNDRPHISYQDGMKGDLKYAVLESASLEPLISCDTPGEPLNLQAVFGDGNVTLSWSTPSVDGGAPITKYVIYRSTTPGSKAFLASVENELSFVDDTVENNGTYYYRVSAVNSAGEGMKSNEATATLNQPTTPSDEPTAPSDQPITPSDAFYIAIIAAALILGLLIVTVVVRKFKSNRNE